MMRKQLIKKEIDNDDFERMKNWKKGEKNNF